MSSQLDPPGEHLLWRLGLVVHREWEQGGSDLEVCVLVGLGLDGYCVGLQPGLYVGMHNGLVDGRPLALGAL